MSLDANSPTLTQLLEREIEDFSPVVGMNTMSRAVAGPGALHDNAVTMGKMIDLRRRMETLSVHRQGPRALTDTPGMLLMVLQFLIIIIFYGYFVLVVTI